MDGVLYFFGVGYVIVMLAHSWVPHDSTVPHRWERMRQGVYLSQSECEIKAAVQDYRTRQSELGSNRFMYRMGGWVRKTQTYCESVRLYKFLRPDSDEIERWEKVWVEYQTSPFDIREWKP